MVLKTDWRHKNEDFENFDFNLVQLRSFRKKETKIRKCVLCEAKTLVCFYVVRKI